MSKKIGILAFVSKQSGGIYQYTESIIDALKKDINNEYVLFCSKDETRFDNVPFEIRKIDLPQINLFKRVIRYIQYYFFLRKPLFFTKKEEAAFRDISVFLSPTISTYPHFYLNKPFVFTLHDMQECYYPNFFTKKELVLRWLLNRTLSRSANKIICESNFVKNDIVKFTRVNEGKVNVIQTPPPENFLNFKFNDKNFELIKEKYNLPEKFIFYPAQCWLHKNHIKLVEAFEIVAKKHKDIFLVLTGSQSNNYNTLVNRITELNLNERILHLGYIDYEDLSYFYKLSQFLVMPTLFESVSIPIYEAFSLEVPVCSSNVVALPEQVGDSGLIFDPLDINDMAEKMLLFIENEGLRIEKGKKGFESVTNFNHEMFQEKIVKVLNN